MQEPLCLKALRWMCFERQVQEYGRNRFYGIVKLAGSKHDCLINLYNQLGIHQDICMYGCMYVYVCMCVCVYIYICMAGPSGRAV